MAMRHNDRRHRSQLRIGLARQALRGSRQENQSIDRTEKHLQPDPRHAHPPALVRYQIMADPYDPLALDMFRDQPRRQAAHPAKPVAQALPIEEFVGPMENEDVTGGEDTRLILVQFADRDAFRRERIGKHRRIGVGPSPGRPQCNT